MVTSVDSLIYQQKRHAFLDDWLILCTIRFVITMLCPVVAMRTGISAASLAKRFPAAWINFDEITSHRRWDIVEIDIDMLVNNWKVQVLNARRNKTENSSFFYFTETRTSHLFWVTLNCTISISDSPYPPARGGTSNVKPFNLP